MLASSGKNEGFFRGVGVAVTFPQQRKIYLCRMIKDAVFGVQFGCR